MAIEIVDLPIKHGDFFHSFLYVYHRGTIHDTIQAFNLVEPPPAARKSDFDGVTQANTAALCQALQRVWVNDLE